MIAGCESVTDVVRDEQRADGKAVGETLRQRHEIRAHTELLEGEERSRSPHPGLDLVQAQKRWCFCGRCHELRIEWANAALPEDRLEQDEPDLIIDGCEQPCDVVRPNEPHARDERLEGRTLPWLPGNGERAERAAVEPALERDDARLSRHLPCEL